MKKMKKFSALLLFSIIFLFSCATSHHFSAEKIPADLLNRSVVLNLKNGESLNIRSVKISKTQIFFYSKERLSRFLKSGLVKKTDENQLFVMNLESVKSMSVESRIGGGVEGLTVGLGAGALTGAIIYSIFGKNTEVSKPVLGSLVGMQAGILAGTLTGILLEDKDIYYLKAELDSGSANLSLQQMKQIQ